MTYISAAMSPDRRYVDVWERHEDGVKKVRYDAEYNFYMRSNDGPHKDLFGNTLKKITFDEPKEFYDTKRQYTDMGLKLYESDINPVYKALSKHYYKKDVGKLNFTFLDIEVDYDPNRGFSSPKNPYAPVSAISLYHHHKNEMVLLVVLPDNGKWKASDIPQDLHDMSRIHVCKDEFELLTRFLDEIHDSDILSGWNSEMFDIPYLYMRMLKRYGESMANKLSFPDAPIPKVKEVEVFKGTKEFKIQLFGRCHIDYMEMMKKFEATDRPSWSLEAVSEDETPEFSKLEYDGTLYSLYYDNFPHFCRYNVRDSEVLKAFEEKFSYMEVAILNYHSSTALVNDVLGTVKIVECALINHCHYGLRVRVPDSKPGAQSDEKFAGALVLPPKMGMHKWVFSVDVNSLYPSAIRTLNISPEMLIGQCFSNFSDFEEITNRTDRSVTIIYEADGDSETRPAKEWPEIFIERKWAISGYGTIFKQDEKGFIPAVLESWYADRKMFKAKIKEAYANAAKYPKDSAEYLKYMEEAAFYDRKQFIMKLLLNSTYGCMGNEFFKFFDIRMAESTTRSGREILMHMVMTISLHLDGEYAYPTESFIYSDTDSCYALAPVDNLNDAVKVAKIIEKRVNESFGPFTEKQFFCVGDFNTLVQAELDVISDSSIFVKKKFYIMHLLYSDGKPTEKMKVMGLQIKKTIVPAPIRKTLTKYMEEFLLGTSWNDIAKKIVDYKSELFKSNIKDLGIPTAIKTLDDYTNRWKNKEPGLTLPGHVSASIYYNKCLEDYGDKESMPIVAGMKIKRFILKKPDGKFKAIALPSDAKFLPKWFVSDFVQRIDRDAQLKRLVDGPIESIVVAIGEHAPTHKTVMASEVFEF